MINENEKELENLENENADLTANEEDVLDEEVELDEDLEEDIDEDDDEELNIAQIRKAVVPEEFDWNNLTNRGTKYSADVYTQFESLYNETLSTISENEVIEGTVISMNKREVVINIGFKSEGVVSLNEFRYNPELVPGNKGLCRKQRRQKRTINSISQKSSCFTLMGSC